MTFERKECIINNVLLCDIMAIKGYEMTSKKILAVLSVLFCLTVAFIWGNSVLSPEASSKFSNFVVEILQKFELLIVPDNSTNAVSLVRKLAHLLEHLVLGILSYSLITRKCVKYALPHLVAIGICVPSIDETIQIFSGRGPSILDILIDLLGYCLGALIAFAISKLFKRLSET